MLEMVKRASLVRRVGFERVAISHRKPYSELLQLARCAEPEIKEVIKIAVSV